MTLIDSINHATLTFNVFLRIIPRIYFKNKLDITPRTDSFLPDVLSAPSPRQEAPHPHSPHSPHSPHTPGLESIRITPSSSVFPLLSFLFTYARKPWTGAEQQREDEEEEEEEEEVQNQQNHSTTKDRGLLYYLFPFFFTFLSVFVYVCVRSHTRFRTLMCVCGTSVTSSAVFIALSLPRGVKRVHSHTHAQGRPVKRVLIMVFACCVQVNTVWVECSHAHALATTYLFSSAIKASQPGKSKILSLISLISLKRTSATSDENVCVLWNRVRIRWLRRWFREVQVRFIFVQFVLY